METLTFAAVAAFILGFGLISRRLQQSIITPPIAFVVFGLLISSRVTGLSRSLVDNEVINLIAELTLILILFTDASRIDLKLLRREHDIPIRLLAIGLPLIMIGGALVGVILLGFLSFWEAVILAIILAPTDAALGQAVVSSPRVPVRIRQALNVESGLNDGIALPILLFFVSIAGAAEALDYGFWLQFAAAQIILGPIVGVAVGYAGGWVTAKAQEKDWMADTFQKLAAVGLSLLAFSLAELIGGNGFIAAFCAGLILGNAFQRVCGRLYEFAETEGQLLTLITFLIFGSVLVFPALDQITGPIMLYSFLSLTVIRMVPVALSLIGLGLHWPTYLFLGWFGPRGIASILYGLVIVEEANLAGDGQIFTTMVTTVLLSVFAHGLTAWPAANWYGAKTDLMKDEPNMPELMTVPEMPTRLSYQ